MRYDQSGGYNIVKQLHNDVDTESTVAHEALMRLFQLTVVLGEEMEKGLVERGLTRARAAVIWQLHQQSPVTQRTLSQALRVSPRNVTGLLDALEAGGYVTRGRHPTDRRATLVSLTEQGAAAAARLHADYQMGARVLLGGVSAADLATFVGVLDHVLDRLRGASAASPAAPDVSGRSPSG
jgi:DNA-binding MarR family transcriptional regulator